MEKVRKAVRIALGVFFWSVIIGLVVATFAKGRWELLIEAALYYIVYCICVKNVEDLFDEYSKDRFNSIKK